MPISELQLARWTNRSSDHEEEKCERASRMIRQALEGHTGLQRRQYRLIAQGSYHNNTNVRLESDVDLCVVFTDVVHLDCTYAVGESLQSRGLTPISANYANDRVMIGEALASAFGRNMTSGKKAFDVHSNNSTRVDADVVPAWEFWGVHTNNGATTDRKGIVFWSTDGKRIINFPEQHHASGKTKNIATQRAYKRATRILKQLRYKMLEDNVRSADGVSSFVLECAMYNVPNAEFNQSTWQRVMACTIQHMITEIKSGRAHAEWVEVSHHKWLFKDNYGIPSNRTAQQLLDFLLDASGYLAA
jgi:hypothetical protein